MKRITLAAAALALLAACKSGGKSPAGPGSGTAPVLALSTSSLSFSAAAGAAGPASQFFTVSNAGGGTLPAPAVEVSYASGAGWISAAAVSGAAAPYTVTVEIASGALAAGSYQATLSIASAGASNGPLAVAVALTVDAPTPVPLLELGSSGLTFQAEEGGAAPAAQTFTASNAGSGALAAPTAEVSYQGGASWISAATVSGGTAPYEVRVEVSPAGLAAGSYQATLALSSAGAGNGPLALPVTLVVSPHRASMAVAPRGMDFGTRDVGGGDPTPMTATATAFGAGTLATPTATVLYDSGSGWVKSVQLSGSAPPYTVTVSPTLAGLGAGSYQARVRLEAAGSPNGPVEIWVYLKLLDQPSMLLQAEATTFAGLAGGASPAAQVVQATNTSGGALRTPVFTIDYLGGPSGWLTASGPSNYSPLPITLTPSSSGLAAGTYRANVTVAMDGVLNAPRTIAVTMVLADPAGPALAISPGSATLQTAQGSSPAAATVSVSQSGAGTPPTPSVAVNYVRGGGWLTATLSGSAYPYTLTLTPSTASLPPGQYKANVLVVASPASNSPQVLPVVLRVMRRIQVRQLCTSWFHDGAKQTATCPGASFVLGGITDTQIGNYTPNVNCPSPGDCWADMPTSASVHITRTLDGLDTVWDSATSSFDLGSDIAGWPYPVWSGVTNNVTWQLSGLSPWQPGQDQVLLHSWDAGFADTEVPVAAADATALSVAVDFDTNRGKGLPMLRSRDDVNSLQLRSFDTPSGGATYQGAVAAWSTTGIQMLYGVPATVVPPALPAPAQASALSAAWRHSQFQAGLPPATGTLPAGHELSIVAVPVPLEAPSPFRQGSGLPLLVLQRVGGALADADYGVLSYQRHLGAGWRHYRFAGHVAPVSRAAPGAAPVDFLDYVARYDDADAVSGPIIPLVTGVSSITIDGLDAMQPRSGLGSGYVYVSFGRPALASGPVSARVTLYELTNSGGKTVVSAVEEKLSLHSFYLQAGRAYVFGVQLIQGPVDAWTSPWREGVPLGASMVYSAVITP